MGGQGLFKIFSMNLFLTLGGGQDYISGCVTLSFKSQSVSLLQAYLLLELLCSAFLAETSGKCPLVFGVTRMGGGKYLFNNADPTYL